MMDTYMLFHFLEVRSTEYFLLLQLLMVVVVVVVVVVALILVIQRKLLSCIIYLYFLLLLNDIQSVWSTGLTTALAHRVLRRTTNYSIYSSTKSKNVQISIIWSCLYICNYFKSSSYGSLPGCQTHISISGNF